MWSIWLQNVHVIYLCSLDFIHEYNVSNVYWIEVKMSVIDIHVYGYLSQPITSVVYELLNES